jgi:hypothetical protein
LSSSKRSSARSGYHRDYLLRCIRIHTGEIGPAWKQAEVDSQKLVDDLLQEFKARGRSSIHALPAVQRGRLRRLKTALFDEPVRRIQIGPIHPGHFRTEGKYGFVIDPAELGVFARSDQDHQGQDGMVGVSRLELLEDETPLGPPHQMHDIIRNKGKGAYSHWGTRLHFSTSDNSDLRSNGREYTIRVPESLGGFVRRSWWKLKRRMHAA